MEITLNKFDEVEIQVKGGGLGKTRASETEERGTKHCASLPVGAHALIG